MARCIWDSLKERLVENIYRNFRFAHTMEDYELKERIHKILRVLTELYWV